MALWGISSGSEAKPKYLTQEEKNNTYAVDAGWEKKTVVGSRTLTELLVAVGSNTVMTTALAEATISSVFFTDSAYAQADAGSVTISWNEKVDITNGATLVVTGSVTGAVTATAAAQTGTNTGVFNFTVPSQTEDLSIGAQTVSGTIVDTGTSTVSDKVFVTGDVTSTAISVA